MKKSMLYFFCVRTNLLKEFLIFSNLFYYKKNKINHGVFQNFLLTTMLLNIATKPDFIAYNFKYASHPAFWFWTKIGKIPAYAWTIRSQKDLKKAEKNFQVFIFEGFEPKEEQ